MRHFANYFEAPWRITVPTRTFLTSPTFFYLLIVGVGDHCCNWSHSVTHTHSVGLLWTSDQLVAGTTTWLHTKFTRQTSMLLAGFELAVPASERPQTHALDRAAIGIRPVRGVTLYSEGEASDGFMAHIITSRAFYISSYQFVCHIFALRSICLFSKMLTHWGRGHLNCLNARSRGF